MSVIQRSLDDFLQERNDRIPWGKAVLEAANALAERLVEIAIERALVKSSLVAECIIQSGPGDAHLVSQVAHRGCFIPATPGMLDRRVQHRCFVKLAWPAHDVRCPFRSPRPMYAEKT